MDLLELPWLPPAAENFRAQVKAMRGTTSPDLVAIKRVATARLDVTQLTSLARAIPAAGASDVPWVKVSVLSNGTVDLLLPAIAATAPRHDIWIDVVSSDFAMFMHEALDPDSATNRRRNDFVLLALDHRALPLVPVPGNVERATEAVDAAVKTLLELANALHVNGGATVIVQTLAPPYEALFGSLDTALVGTLQWLIEEFNRRLRDTHTQGVLLFDVASLASTVGLGMWHDAQLWNVGKFAFSYRVIPLYADHFCRLVMAARGKAKKCLVLDLDNTLWGGVIGDDGLAGIVVGQGSPLGEAYLAVQAAALMLRARGIVLAVSSKNTEAVARQVFREHPEMLLREEHIAVFQANWDDKATNLQAIAATLNIGIDSLVFLDDNPAERQQIRLALPAVGVPELPDSPELFASTLLCAGYFESVQFTAEDRERAAQYQDNAARTARLGAATNLDAYLASLGMTANFAPFNEVGRARITQLINKTNQFNLTTRRYTEAEVKTFERDAGCFTLQIRLKDQFGDNGMISLVICREHHQDWIIDTWLMSCRVLNRRLEHEVLNTIMTIAKERSVRSLVGIFEPSGRNEIVREHYPKLGFALRCETPSSIEWTLDVSPYIAHATAIAIEIDESLLAPRRQD